MIPIPTNTTPRRSDRIDPAGTYRPPNPTPTIDSTMKNPLYVAYTRAKLADSVCNVGNTPNRTSTNPPSAPNHAAR
jgi:hypothetical protein